MKVTEKWSGSSEVKEREVSEIIAEYIQSMDTVEQIFFFELFNEIANGNLVNVKFTKEAERSQVTNTLNF